MSRFIKKTAASIHHSHNDRQRAPYFVIKFLLTHKFKGTALVDILQPCVSFNKTNTYQWYRGRVFKLGTPLTDRYQALKPADLWGEKIPIGVIYRKEEA